MSALHGLLIGLGLAFVLFWLAAPRYSRLHWTYARYVLLGLAALVVLMPFFWLVCSAFKDKSVLMQYTFMPPLKEWGPDTLNLANFRELFAGEETPQGRVRFWHYLLNSLFLASAATTIQVFLCSLTGFALAKYEFLGKKPVMLFMLGSMMIPGMILLAPVYQLIVRFGWIDTYWALLVPGAVPVFGVFLYRQSMLSVPDELMEAARIDGCSEFGIYWNLVMPLVRPMTGAFCLVSFLGAWNSFLAPQIFIHTKAKLPLPVALTQYMGIYSEQYGVYLAGTLLAIIPPAILFFALQKEFVSGLARGAIKG